MKNRGFTLIEVLFSIVIVTIVSGAIIGFAKNVLGLNQSASQSLTAQLEGRRLMKNIVKELRTASPSATGAYTIEMAEEHELVFYADLDSDGRTERIRYFLDGPDLKRGVVAPNGNPPAYDLGDEEFSVMATDVLDSDPIFEYHDTNYAGTSTPLSIPVNIPLVRLVRIVVRIDHDPNRPPLPMVLESEVTLRNLKDNL